MAKLFAAISGKTFDESVDIILTTNTGRAIVQNNPCALYEQATDNVWDIAGELQGKYPDVGEKFTPQRIAETYAGGAGAFPTKRTRFFQEDRLKEARKKTLREAREKRLRFLMAERANEG